jgi:hypothetical protein
METWAIGGAQERTFLTRLARDAARKEGREMAPMAPGGPKLGEEGLACYQGGERRNGGGESVCQS